MLSERPTMNTTTQNFRLSLPDEPIAAFCRNHGIRKLCLFGSVLRQDFGPQSDVDVLVEFEPGARTGLRFFEMQEELSALIGRKVDLNTPGFLGEDFRDHVLAEAEVCYVAPFNQNVNIT
jgi:predicted nucleotidyltransferase